MLPAVLELAASDGTTTYHAVEVEYTPAKTVHVRYIEQPNEIAVDAFDGDDIEPALNASGGFPGAVAAALTAAGWLVVDGEGGES